jgi:hypothetical protein
MMFVQFHFQKYLHGSGKVLNAYGRHGEPNMLIVDQIQVLPTFPHKATTSLFTQGKKEIKSNTFWNVGFGLQNSTNLRRLPRSHTDLVWGI